MAKFISILVTNDGAPLTAGPRLVNADAIVSVSAVSATKTQIVFSTQTATFDTIEVNHDSTGTVPSIKNAINDALTGVPGGQTVVVSLPSGITVSSMTYV